MFGMSLGKLLVLALVLAVVWTAFRWLQRTNAIKEAEARRHRVASLGGEETVRCSRCDVFVVARTAGDCGRVGCPFAKAGVRTR